MNREQKIEAIYKKIADKTLKKGCKVKRVSYVIVGKTKKSIIENFTIIQQADFFDNQYTKKIKDTYYCYSTYFDDYETEVEITEVKIKADSNYDFKIIGHDVMIGDVLDFQGKVIFFNDFCIRDEICNLWEEKRKPIEDQSDECIDYIYNLLF